MTRQSGGAGDGRVGAASGAVRQGDARVLPRRRAVRAVMPCAVEALEQYPLEVRLRYGAAADRRCG